ncbi:hypothetical protein CYMTET_19447 [Cymbomonas tetramitiformis]|uniref:Caltractin n=1 Tax=Cymbomonas tetramitiformis TaxID=36881 RepID=A0AAE0G6K1_9CHLO|nr:hypothetical protein CYMTET_19447 [Cymbomonas tetramitiformis]
MKLKNCPFNVANSIEAWLRSHGKSIRPELSSEQKADLEECFDLIDADGSGAIDVDELNTAFKVLGLKMKRKDIEKLMNDVDADGSGEVEYEEFVEIMTTTLEKRSKRDDPEDAGDRGAASPAPLPFELLATAYRRKKLLEAVMGGDRQQRNRMSAKAARAIHAAEEREREVAELETLAKLVPKPQPKKSRVLLQRVLTQNKGKASASLDLGAGES